MSPADLGTAARAIQASMLAQTVLAGVVGGIILAAALSVFHKVWARIQDWNRARFLAHHLLRMLMFRVEALEQDNEMLKAALEVVQEAMGVLRAEVDRLSATELE